MNQPELFKPAVPQAKSVKRVELPTLVDVRYQRALSLGLIANSDMGKEIFTHACYDYTDKD